YSTKSTEDQEKNLISIHQNQVSSKISIILTNFALAIRIHEASVHWLFPCIFIDVLKKFTNFAPH
ncbi:MAG: hypothetical protein SPL28_02215, partial [Bacteroidales bacterium]|nr:hypothetical protein [Bacteroidales bacterium]